MKYAHITLLLLKKHDMIKINGTTIAQRGYYINLDSSEDRRSKVESQIEKYKIEGLERFSAITDPFLAFSCTKSHLEIFKKCKEDDIETVLILEDDFEIRERYTIPETQIGTLQFDFKKTLNNVMLELKQVDWDVVLFGCNPVHALIPETNLLARNFKSTGAWAYLINKKAYTYILENSNYFKDYLAIDNWLPFLSYLKFNVFATTPCLISHGVGLESTLNPQGPVNYDAWIEGNYNKHLYSHIKTNDFVNDFPVERNITVVVAGHFVENYPIYLDHLLQSLPTSIYRCRFIVHYDINTSIDSTYPLTSYFKDIHSELNVQLSFGFGGLINTFKTILDKVTTPYFIFLEHDWVFLHKDNIDFINLVKAFDAHSFINAVWFSKDDNEIRNFEIATDINNNVTPFEKEQRVTEIDLITTCRWSNNPVMFRTDKVREWYKTIIHNKYVGVTHQSSNNVEERMVPHYREEISKNTWEDIRDKWGTFLYGKIGEGPFVGHTDASRRYLTTSRSQPEINGDAYMEQHPISESTKEYINKLFGIIL